MEKFHCKTKILAGRGALAALKEWNIGKLFLVCDPFFVKNGVADAVVAASGCGEHRIFSQVVPDPSVTLAANGAAQVKEFGPEAVVALGGGSAMDAAKAMAYFSGLRPLLVAIPTTSGSGSEVTDFAILTHQGVKHPLVDEKLQPDAAILDTQLVTSLPPALVADGGFDLISHAVEAYVATGSGIFSSILAENALKTALECLQSSYEGDGDSRGKMHIAATMAGMAFSQAGLGLCHAIAHSLGGAFHLPHGRLNAILLPAVMDQNSAVCGAAYARLARAVGLSSGSDVMAQRALKNGLLRLRRGLQLPQSLAQAGVHPSQVQEKMESLVQSALADPCCKTNPLPPDEEMVRSILIQVTGRG